MNSRVSLGVESIDASVRERAEATARRAGMSLNDWLNSTVSASSAANLRDASDPWQVPVNQHSREVADIHERLDSITRQIEQISRPAPRAEAHVNEQNVARQLNEAISRLDARLTQISSGASARDALLQKQRQAEAVERAAHHVYRPSPPVNPVSLESAIAEIAARQSELDAPPRPMPSRNAPPIAPETAAPPPAGPDFSVLEKHLLKITSQIEALQPPAGIEQSIAAFRSELSQIRQAITEAMPRRAIESIEDEIRSLSRRIDENRNSGIDAPALAGVERALGDIREVLRSLTPAEQLAGFDEAIRALGAKLDLILRANDDPSTVEQLEATITALRAVVVNVASNDALVQLSDDVRTLAYKVDQLARVGDHSESFALLEQRIAALTSSLESRGQATAGAGNEHLENAVRTLSERLDRLPVGNDGASDFAHLEQRVSYLLERLEASEHSGGNLGLVERGLHDILRHLETQHALFEALADNKRTAQPTDSALIDMVKRELSDIRSNQSESGRHTQNSLEVLHGRLGHVVDRLAIIEGDLRTGRPTLDAAEATASSPPKAVPPAAPRTSVAPEAKPELPHPAAQNQFVAAPRDFHAASPSAPAPPVLPKAISEIFEPPAARAAIEPNLPPDHPLEPGTRPAARTPSPSERIAASEDAISQIPSGVTSERARASSFIAAARRAAQAAQAANANEKAGRGGVIQSAADKAKQVSSITSKIRSLLVGASVVVIVLGSFKLTMSLLEGGSSPQQASIESRGEAVPAAQSPINDSLKLDAAPTAPTISSPSPMDRQSLNSSAPSSSESAVSVPIPQTTPKPEPSPISADVTNAIPSPPASPRQFAMVPVPPSERLPDAIGGPAIRAAALKGDPTAAYEIALRFAEGRGVASNYDQAAKWYDRAAQAGVIPAVFRLGTLYEKGLGVQKDADIARRYYMQAAERGNAKAMHNLAVLDADGGGKGANYKSAAQWFRKAADRGIADSQFNLGVLYARGIGVDQNLAESFKWFSLAAAQGDADSARKRDDIARRLDAQSLAAAQLALRTFTPESQPDDAVNVPAPPGGWDSAPAASATRPVAKPVAVKRAAQ